MKNLRKFSQKPLGQALMATLLFCFIFVALFVGVFKAGTVYIAKEQIQRSTNLTALSAGAVYVNGLQLVRESNVALMFFVDVDLFKDGLAAAAAVESGPAGMVAAAYTSDKVNSRTAFQKFQDIFFGVDMPGVYPLLVEGQALSTASENKLSFLPAYAYNCETATAANVGVPNLALRFRTASDLLPEPRRGLYSLSHNGERNFFSRDEVEPARNPRHPSQMRVKKWSGSEFAGWWVRKEKNGTGVGTENGPLSKLGSSGLIRDLKKFLDHFKFDVADRDDPPCHTFALLSSMGGQLGEKEGKFYQAGEVRVETEGLAAWDTEHPFSVYLQKVDIDSFPVLKNILQKINNIPLIGQILKSSDILNGL